MLIISMFTTKAVINPACVILIGRFQKHYTSQVLQWQNKFHYHHRLLLIASNSKTWLSTPTCPVAVSSASMKCTFVPEVTYNSTVFVQCDCDTDNQHWSGSRSVTLSSKPKSQTNLISGTAVCSWRRPPHHTVDLANVTTSLLIGYQHKYGTVLWLW